MLINFYLINNYMRSDIIAIVIVIIILLCWIISRNKKVEDKDKDKDKDQDKVKVLEENKPDIRVREKRFYDTLTYDFQ